MEYYDRETHPCPLLALIVLIAVLVGVGLLVPKCGGDRQRRNTYYIIQRQRDGKWLHIDKQKISFLTENGHHKSIPRQYEMDIEIPNQIPLGDEFAVIHMIWDELLDCDGPVNGCDIISVTVIPFTNWGDIDKLIQKDKDESLKKYEKISNNR